MATQPYGRSPRPDTKFTWIDGAATATRVAMVAAVVLLATAHPAVHAVLHYAFR